MSFLNKMNNKISVNPKKMARDGAIVCTVTAAISATIFLLPNLLFAQTRPINCQSPQTDEVNYCTAIAAKDANTQMNKIYQQLEDKRSNDRKLIDSQKAWVSFRDLNCKFTSGRYSVDTISSLIYSQCMERLTKQRTTELQSYLKRKEYECQCVQDADLFPPDRRSNAKGLGEPFISPINREREACNTDSRSQGIFWCRVVK